MGIGINLNDNIRVELGQLREQLIKDLDKQKLEYVIPFDKLNKKGIKETIIHIKELDTEVSCEKDKVTYIKIGNTEFSHLDTIEDITGNTLLHIKKVQELIAKKFEGYNMKIERLDSNTMSITVIISSAKEKARMHVIRNSAGQVYINTIIRI